MQGSTDYPAPFGFPSLLAGAVVAFLLPLVGWFFLPAPSAIGWIVDAFLFGLAGFAAARIYPRGPVLAAGLGMTPYIGIVIWVLSLEHHDFVVGTQLVILGYLLLALVSAWWFGRRQTPRS